MVGHNDQNANHRRSLQLSSNAKCGRRQKSWSSSVKISNWSDSCSWRSVRPESIHRQANDLLWPRREENRRGVIKTPKNYFCEFDFCVIFVRSGLFDVGWFVEPPTTGSRVLIIIEKFRWSVKNSKQSTKLRSMKDKSGQIRSGYWSDQTKWLIRSDQIRSARTLAR